MIVGNALHYLEKELNEILGADTCVWEFLRAGSLDGVWYWDLERPEHEYMSPEFWELFGIDPATKKHLAAEWQDMIFPEDLELASANLEAHLADPSHPYDQTVRYRHAEGHTIWVRCRGLAIRDDTGKPTRLLGAHNDITAQKREEQEASEARRKAQEDLNFVEMVLENIPDYIFVKDQDLKIVLGNQNFLDIYPERARGGVIGSTTAEHFDEIERDKFFEQDRIALEKGRTETEETIDLPNGERRTLYTKKVRFEDGEGGPFVLGISQDITELVQTRQQSEQSLRLLEGVFDAVGSAIIALDAQGQIMQLNNQARHMLGGISDLPPLTWPATVNFLDSESMKSLDNSANPIQRALSGHVVRHETHLLWRPQSRDQQRYVRVDCEPVLTSGSDIKLVVVLDDITVEERSRQVAERQNRLDALGQLTGGIAHDFNNLLGALMYAIDLAQDEEDAETRKSYLETASRSVSRGRDLTSHLLAFASRQPGLATASRTEDTFEEFRKLIRPTLEASINLELSVEDPDMMQFCDRSQLETALMNLVLNSRDAILRSGTGDTIKVKARIARSKTQTQNSRTTKKELLESFMTHEETPDRYVEINVIDNGPGMDDETLKRCTDPFFTTKPSNSGTGLGLAMVYGFARQSSGDLRISSDLGIGTNVQLLLPRASTDGSREPAAAEPPFEHGQGQTILVVEDEPMLLMMAEAVLEKIGYRVVSASSGSEALAIINSGEPVDLLLTDVVMPNGIGGFELAKRVRELLPTLPVIYTSGYTGYTVAEMGGVQAPLLRKPTPRIVLAKAITTALDKRVHVE